MVRSRKSFVYSHFWGKTACACVHSRERLASTQPAGLVAAKTRASTPTRRLRGVFVPPPPQPSRTRRNRASGNLWSNSHVGGRLRGCHDSEATRHE